MNILLSIIPSSIELAIAFSRVASGTNVRSRRRTFVFHLALIIRHDVNHMLS
jgi:hypothetical protein